jgi:monoamine oxidase
VVLGRPLLDRVHFAGEAASVEAPGTLQGAYASGQRAADAVAAAFPSSATVVVVGAGIAGLAAARRWDDRLGLAATVLEGRERVGGRIATDRSWGRGVAVEAGAPWTYGAGNPLLALCDQLGVAHRSLPSTPTATRQDGIAVPRSRLATAHQLGQDLRELALGEALRLPPVASLADALDQATLELRRAHPGLDPDLEQLVALDVLTGWTQPQAADAAALSIRSVPPVTADRSTAPGGLDQLTRVLAQDMDVRLSRPAVAIEWSAGGVVVQTNSGPIPADAVIVTTPLGVLQTGQPHFDPPLPTDTQAAIAALDPGRYEQCYLRFPRRFWGDDVVIDLVSRPLGSWNRWFDVTASVGSPTLLGVNAGAAAERLDDLSDREVVAEAVAALRDAYR